MGWIHGNNDRTQNSPESDLLYILQGRGVPCYNLNLCKELLPYWEKMKEWHKNVTVEFLKRDRALDAISFYLQVADDSMLPEEVVLEAITELTVGEAVCEVKEFLFKKEQEENEYRIIFEEEKRKTEEAFNLLGPSQQKELLEMALWSSENWAPPEECPMYESFQKDNRIGKRNLELALRHVSRVWENFYNPLTGKFEE